MSTYYVLLTWLHVRPVISVCFDNITYGYITLSFDTVVPHSWPVWCWSLVIILRLYFYHEFASGQVCLCHSLFFACSVSVQTLNLTPSMLILFDPPVTITFSHVIKECQFLLYMRFMKYIYTHFLGVSKFFLFLIVLTLTLDEISSVDPDGWFEGSTTFPFFWKI